MGSGLARGARDRGKRVAFGDGRRIYWGPMCEEVYRNNPNIARPGSEGARDLEWLAYYKGNRQYNKGKHNRWVFNYNWTAKPGEMFFDRAEIEAATKAGSGFVLIEPNVPLWKRQSINKDWGFARYQIVANLFLKDGYDVCQFRHARNGRLLRGVRYVETQTFRAALAVLAGAKLYVGPEGGLHHGAAAVGVPAVVLFGGFTPPQITGYRTHTNLTGGAEACGSLDRCDHCRLAMEAIGTDEVHAAALRCLRG